MGEKLQADVVILGGGIVGAAIARELSRYQLDIILLEKAPDLAMGTSKANSGIIHAGFDAHPDTLKAKLNVRGNELYHQLAPDLGFSIKFVGSLVVAKDEAEQPMLQELLDRGRENGVPGLEILSAQQVLTKEPNLTADIRGGALWAPTAGIVCPFQAVFAFADNAVINGVKIMTECEAQSIATSDGQVVGVETSRGFIGARFVVNAAGLFADELSRTAGDDSFTIQPRKGEYILFDRKVGDLVNSVIFPTPNKVSKGILIAPTVHGNLFIGPNAEDIDDKCDVSTTCDGMNYIIEGAGKLIDRIPLAACIAQFAGLRATAADGDFIIRSSTTVGGLIHAAGIQSPGLTAAPAIAEMVAELLNEQGLDLREKPDFQPKNPPQIHFAQLSVEEQQQLIAQNPLYGRVICRCETVTEAEIVAAIHAPCGAKTVDAVKRRTRAGTGRCQGGFCGPRVTAILARELNIPIPAVRKDTAESNLFFDKLPADGEVNCHD